MGVDADRRKAGSSQETMRDDGLLHTSRSGVLSRAGGMALLLVLVGGAAQTPQEPDDVRAAFASARAKAEAGDVVAQFSLGAMLYRAGTLDEAVDWLERAAAQGYAAAEFHLGQAAESGVGVPHDPDAAFRWYRRAADQGFAPAERAIGDAYRLGHPVRRDPVAAAQWYERAAIQGDLRAQYHLGQLYFDGDGVTRDYVWAYVWFERAATQTPLEDNRLALIELRNIAGVRLSSDELGRARELLENRRP
jgi:TPR repeat protein